MTVSELIEMLKKCPSEANVLLAYDSFVCRGIVERENCFILEDNGDDYYQAGVYLCAMDPCSVEYERKGRGLNTRDIP
jgi:hypothetical protein